MADQTPSQHLSPRQREFYTIYLRLYQALMTSIQVHARPADIIRNAVVKMDAVMAGFTFKDANIKQAATAFVERYRKSRANSLASYLSCLRCTPGRFGMSDGAMTSQA